MGKGEDRAARNYYAAYLAAVRDYCQAYHGGSNRAAMIDLLIKTKTETRAAAAQISLAGAQPERRDQHRERLDMQKWYGKSKMTTANLPLERIIDTGYGREAVAKCRRSCWKTRTASFLDAGDDARVIL